MDLHTAMIDERRLRRFIAWLLSFADLAEQAAGRSDPVRWLVLWILRRAEALLEEAVFEIAGAPPLPLEGLAGIGNEPQDALRLAARFRAMAAILVALLSIAWPFGPFDYPLGRRCLAAGRFAPGFGHICGGRTPELIDTS